MAILTAIISAITAIAVVSLPIFLKGEMKTCSARQIEEIKTDMDIMRGELLRTRIIFLKDKKSEENYRLILRIYDEILELRKKHDDKTIGNGYLDEVVERIKREWQKTK